MSFSFPQQTSRKKLEKILDYTFTKPHLGVQALTWRMAGSYTKRRTQSYLKFEQMEFLGDRIYNLCVTTRLLTEMGGEVPIGTIESAHQSFVKNNYLAQAALHYGLDQLLLDSKGNRAPFKIGVDNPKKLADVTEAIFGAVFTDCQCNFMTLYDIYLSKFHSRSWEILHETQMESTL